MDLHKLFSGVPALENQQRRSSPLPTLPPESSGTYHYIRCSVSPWCTGQSTSLPKSQSPDMGSSGFSPYDRRELGSTGVMVPPLGFGASTLGGIFGAVDVRLR